MTNLSPAQVLRCLLHKDCWSAFGLPLGDSFDENHRPVYDALKSFHERWPEKAVASISALTAFVEKSDRDMLRVVKNATVPDEREVRLDAMRNYAMLNEFSKLAQENGDALAKGKVNIPEMISKLADVERRFAPKEKLIRASTFKFERVKNERTEGALSLPSNDLTIRFDGGPTPGELLTFIAATDGGKTTMLINCARWSAEQGKRVLYVTLETMVKNVLPRWYSSAGPVSTAWLENNPDADRWMAEYRAYLRQRKGDVIWMDGSNREVAVTDIQAAAEAEIEERGALDVVIVDYGDLLRSSRRYGSAREEQREVWKELRRMSKVIGAPVITASQLNRPGNAAVNSNAPPDLTHMGECFAKATDSDLVVLILRTLVHESNHTAELKILKTKKSGGKGAIEVKFDTRTCFVE